MLSDVFQFPRASQVSNEQTSRTLLEPHCKEQNTPEQEVDQGYLPLELNGELALMMSVCG